MTKRPVSAHDLPMDMAVADILISIRKSTMPVSLVANLGQSPMGTGSGAGSLGCDFSRATFR